MDEPSFWVLDGSFAVDTEELLTSNRYLQQALDLVDEAHAAAVAAATNLSCVPAPATSVPSFGPVWDSTQVLVRQLAELRSCIRQLLEWRERAAQIFAGAEAANLTLFRACQQASEAQCGNAAQTWHLLGQYIQFVPWVGPPVNRTVGLAAAGSQAGIIPGSSAQTAGALLAEAQVRGLTDTVARRLTFPWFAFSFAGAGAAEGSPASSSGRLARVAGTGSGMFAARGGKGRGVLVVGADEAAAGSDPDVAGPRVVTRTVAASSWPGTGLPESTLLVGPAAAAFAVGSSGKQREAKVNRAVQTPRHASQTLRQMQSGSAQGLGHIEILRHETPSPAGEAVSWSVLIRGTAEWTVAGPNPQDLQTNLEEVGGLVSDQRVAVLTAMEMAGIAPGQPVELVGHSQGGIVAANLVADPEVLNRFEITSVLTAGSPAALAGPAPESVAKLHLENLDDIVPALEGAANTPQPGTTTVYFEGVTPPAGASAHSLSVYEEAAKALEVEANKAGPGQDWFTTRNEALGLGPKTRTTSSSYWTRRSG